MQKKVCPRAVTACGVSLCIADTRLPAFLTCMHFLHAMAVGFFSSSQVFMEMQGRVPFWRHKVDPLRFLGAPAVIGLA